MNPQFDDIFSSPENQIFKVVFYPDRVFHSQYLNATRSARYRYNVKEVRNKLDITVIKGEVYLDGLFYTNFLRIEYRGSRLVELTRIKQRFLKEEIMGWIELPEFNNSQAIFKLHYDSWIDAYQVEFWENLEAPPNKNHDFMILDMMGLYNQITSIKGLEDALQNLDKLTQIKIAFRENDLNLPSGFQIIDPQWDNNYARSHQEPKSDQPSAGENTIEDLNYLIDFRKGWFLDSTQVKPVRYKNAMMNQNGPEVSDDNVLEMRWILQLELGGSLVFFHEVTIPPGKIEGTHHHVGSEEVYYIVSGEGIAYMGDGDDPTLGGYPIVDRDIYGEGIKKCRELQIKPGKVIYTKSGGIHGIRNTGNVPLKFAAFLYHTV
jgi:mannose-6-phosphate isomerase-like protein (cupin superfamily)